jgi:mannose-1-phosphate guanylyltransferase
MKEADENGNVTEGNILAVDTKDCILQGGQKLIAIAGVQELVVVDTEDATLICSKDGTNQIKMILEQLRQRKQENYL